MPLVKQCVENLDQYLDKDNVLLVYSTLSKCKMPTVKRDDSEPSAPPIIDNENQRGSDWVRQLLDNLRHNCLLVIDANADYVLKKKDVLDLTYNDLFAILDRDTLEVSNELKVYNAMYRWGLQECHRMTLSPHHIKEVLRQLCYVPRYGLMSRKDFACRTSDELKGPMRSGILEEKEWRLIKFYLEEKSKKRDVEKLKLKMSQPRIIGNEKPVVLSSRSEKPPPARVPPVRKESGCSANNSNCERFLINFLACWTAFFD